MTLPSLSFHTQPIMTIINGKTDFSVPVSKIAKSYTLKHFILFYLADFIVLGLFIIVCEWFL
jgi:hypothetical protein